MSKYTTRACITALFIFLNASWAWAESLCTPLSFSKKNHLIAEFIDFFVYELFFVNQGNNYITLCSSDEKNAEAFYHSDGQKGLYKIPKHFWIIDTQSFLLPQEKHEQLKIVFEGETIFSVEPLKKKGYFSTRVQSIPLISLYRRFNESWEFASFLDIEEDFLQDFSLELKADRKGYFLKALLEELSNCQECGTFALELESFFSYEYENHWIFKFYEDQKENGYLKGEFSYNFAPFRSLLKKNFDCGDLFDGREVVFLCKSAILLELLLSEEKINPAFSFESHEFGSLFFQLLEKKNFLRLLKTLNIEFYIKDDEVVFSTSVDGVSDILIDFIKSSSDTVVREEIFRPILPESLEVTYVFDIVKSIENFKLEKHSLNRNMLRWLSGRDVSFLMEAIASLYRMRVHLDTKFPVYDSDIYGNDHALFHETWQNSFDLIGGDMRVEGEIEFYKIPAFINTLSSIAVILEIPQLSFLTIVIRGLIREEIRDGKVHNILKFQWDKEQLLINDVPLYIPFPG